MERIDVWRGEPGLDADGNTVQGPLELVMSFDGLVAPVNTPENVLGRFAWRDLGPRHLHPFQTPTASATPT